MKDIWMKPFVFKANRFEEWANGQCLRQKNADITITASFPDNTTVKFQIYGNIDLVFPKNFQLSLLDSDTGLLADRIQYGGLHSSQTRYPLVCNIFNDTKKCIRFGYWDVSLKIIEFHGEFKKEEVKTEKAATNIPKNELSCFKKWIKKIIR